MRRLCAIFAVVFAVPAFAIESVDSLLLFGFSHHRVTYRDLSETHGYRDCYQKSAGSEPVCENIEHSPKPLLHEANPGFGFERLFVGTELFLRAGVYRDSFAETAFFSVAGRRFMKSFGDGWSSGVDAGFGYLNGSGRAGFAPYLAASFGRDRVHLEMTYIPGRQVEGKDWQADVIAAWLRFEI